MRKFLIISAIFAIITANVFAHNEADSVKESHFFRFNMKEKISYEIRAGLNFSKLSTDLSKTDPDYEGYNLTGTGFNLGLFANLPFLTNIDFQTGLVFATKGGNRLYCFEIQWFISCHKQIKPNLKWNVKAGPYLDFMFGDSEFDNGEFGIIAATGLYFKKLYFGIQYDMGLTNVYRGRWTQDDRGLPNFINFNAYTRTFSIEVGYRF